MLKKYKLYGYLIESDVDFLQLEPADYIESSDKEVISIRKSSIADDVNERLNNKDVNYHIGFDISFFRNTWGYYFIKDGNNIFYEPREESFLEDVKSFLLGYCVSMALLQKRVLTVHCSAVCYPEGNSNDGAVLIAGEPGAGKSTLTRKLLELGFGIMADDVAAIRKKDKVMVYPAFPYQKLCRNEVEKRGLDKADLIYIDEDKDKYLVPVKDFFVGKPQPLKSLIYLVESDKVKEINIQKLKGLMQFMAFKQNLFLYRFGGEWKNSKEFLDMCMSIACECPVYVVARPKGIDSVEDITNALMKNEII